MRLPTRSAIPAILGLLSGLALVSPGAAGVPSVAVEDAVRFCETGLRPVTGQSERQTREQRLNCIVLIDSVVGTVAQLAVLASGNEAVPGRPIRAVFCLPSGVDYPELAETFVAFAQANPDYKRRVAAARLGEMNFPRGGGSRRRSITSTVGMAAPPWRSGRSTRR